MTHNRLDAVLTRNRSNRVRDLVIAAFLPLVVLFSGVAFGAQLPALSSAPDRAARQNAAIAARAAAELETRAMWQTALEEQHEQFYGV
ncbi:MAG TPA: hypothetical protein VKB80_05705 [Kofleriaceae bacterium]|nr:hypothetical protein [Kofleriaceae bacterium]